MNDLELQALLIQVKDLIDRVDELEKEIVELKNSKTTPQSFKKVNGKFISSLDSKDIDE